MKLVRRGHHMPDALQTNYHMVKRAGAVMETPIVLPIERMTLADAMALFAEHPHTECVLASVDGRLAGIVARDDALAAQVRGHSGSGLSDLVRHDYVIVSPRTVLYQAVASLRVNDAFAALVTDKPDAPGIDDIKGLITRRHLGDVLVETAGFYTTDHDRPATTKVPRRRLAPRKERPMSAFDKQVEAVRDWFESPRFAGLVRLYSPREVAEQQGTIDNDYTVASDAAERFYTRLRELFAQRKSITTFGPYSPGQAVTMKRQGIEGIYLGGWATSAKGSITEDPGPIWRATLEPGSRRGGADRASTSHRGQESAFRALADDRSGAQGDPRRRLPPVHHRRRRHRPRRRRPRAQSHPPLRRGRACPGYHIEDQKPGVKKCGHQGGKVLVSQDEQIKRLNAARFQLDVMGVAGIIVARTDAEAATFLEGRGDERDQPFILGATNIDAAQLQDRLPGHHAAALRARGGRRSRVTFSLRSRTSEYGRPMRWLDAAA